MAKPPAFPCPLRPILDAPALKTAQGPVYRATILLAIMYWEAECTIPMHDDVTLASLCRLPTPRMREAKPAIIHALSQITPDLDKIRRKLVKAYEGRYGAIVHARNHLDGRRARARLELLQQPADAPPLLATRDTDSVAIPQPHIIAARRDQRRGDAPSGPPNPSPRARKLSKPVFKD